ncbi:MAG: Glutamine amidotransferase class-I [Solirubrobacterales bacterium]|nr:Glutamine amidotransferase class-I [Solirubrobacterales bacterium]
MGVFAGGGAEIVEWHPPEEPAPRGEHDAVVVLGGSMNVDDERDHAWLAPEKALLRDLLARGTPILGVCLGAQLLAEAAGGEARRAGAPEIGWHAVTREDDAADDPVLGALPPRFEAFQWHSYEALPPPTARTLARSEACVQAFRIADRPAWGIQFHAEVDHATAQGWTRDYRTDPDAVRQGLDPDALLRETARKIAGWNDVGRALFARFLTAAATPA